MKKRSIAALLTALTMTFVITGCETVNININLPAQEGNAASSQAEAGETGAAAETGADEDFDPTDIEPVTRVFEDNIVTYSSVLSSSSPDQYYAFADLDSETDALLIADPDTVFSDEKGDFYSTAATIYWIDADGNIKEYGRAASGTTALPLSVKDHTLYYGNHTQLFTAVLNKESGKLDETVSDSFEALDDDAIEIFFFPISDIDWE